MAIATNRIDDAPRKQWKTLEPIAQLKCGITKGKKLDALKEVFYLASETELEVIPDIKADVKVEVPVTDKEVLHLTPETELEVTPDVKADVKVEAPVTDKKAISNVKFNVKELNKLPLAQLKDMAKQAGISGYSRKRKQELIDLLSKKK